MRKVTKIVIFYDDGTFTESTPVIQRETTNPFSPPYQPFDYKSCSKCGIKLDNVMGYVCSQPHCPTGLGGSWCGVKDPYLD